MVLGLWDGFPLIIGELHWLAWVVHLRWVSESKAWRECLAQCIPICFLLLEGGDDMKVLYDGVEVGSRNLSQKDSCLNESRLFKTCPLCFVIKKFLPCEIARVFDVHEQ
jgi:hypothetical protein